MHDACMVRYVDNDVALTRMAPYTRLAAHKDSMIGIFAIQGLVQTLSREIEHANTE